MCVLSRVRLFATTWTVAYQTPLSTEFSRQEYWNGLPFLHLGDLHNTGIKPTFLVLAGRLSSYIERWPFHLEAKNRVPKKKHAGLAANSCEAQTCALTILLLF